MWLQGGYWQVRWIKWTHMGTPKSKSSTIHPHSLPGRASRTPYAWQRTQKWPYVVKGQFRNGNVIKAVSSCMKKSVLTRMEDAQHAFIRWQISVSSGRKRSRDAPLHHDCSSRRRKYRMIAYIVQITAPSRRRHAHHRHHPLRSPRRQARANPPPTFPPEPLPL